MDKINEEYQRLSYGRSSVRNNNINLHHTVPYGYLRKRTAFPINIFFNWRQWKHSPKTQDIYCINHPYFAEGRLPKQYFYQNLLPELPYGSNDIIFWIWVLKRFLVSNELQLMIVYRLLTCIN